jgi:Fe-S-cluster-containing dehydrogenase component
MDRRDLLKTMGAAAGTALVGSGLKAQAPSADAPAAAPVGILVDTTRCIGCRTCEWACADAHKDAGVEYEENTDFSVVRTTSEKQWTAVNRYETEKGIIYAKKQCMHCLAPACASACLTRAMHKNQEPAGPVVWTAGRCMGCRFCMVSCPFDMPKFQYNKAVPRIEKCVMCVERLAEGKQPACVENCPAGALTFGPRAGLLEEAKQRIYAEPDKYVHQVYGEHEAGGTSWLYLSAVPFEQIGFKTDVGDTPYPSYTREFLYSVPFVEILGPTFMLALSAATKREAEVERAEPESAGRKA